MVGEFLFVRPPSWQWIETRTNNPPILRIIESNGTADVTFLRFPIEGKTGDPVPTVVRWRNTFTKDQTYSRTPKTIGTNKVLLVTITGTHEKIVGKTKLESPNYALEGVHITHPQGNIGVRLVGPAAIVERSKPAFHKMIESALKPD